jgi:hypothetical protein
VPQVQWGLGRSYQGASILKVWIKRRRSREERARKVVQGIRQRLKAGRLPDGRKHKGWKKHPISFSE